MAPKVRWQLMRAVSPRVDVAFVHIPKTGGTAIEMAAWRQARLVVVVVILVLVVVLVVVVVVVVVKASCSIVVVVQNHIPQTEHMAYRHDCRGVSTMPAAGSSCFESLAVCAMPLAHEDACRVA